MAWTYDGRDPGLRLFTAALQAGAPMPIAPGMRVLEIGCCEANWLDAARDAWPEVDLVGIDTRMQDRTTGRVVRRNADARDPRLFSPATFDAVVSVSAVEHIGLGHYGDPRDPDGDTQAMTNIWGWLKPGGWVYFDVPYDPTGYAVLNTECRIYDDQAIWDRLWHQPLVEARAHGDQRWEGYVDSKAPGQLVEKPTVKAARYWYAAHVWQKAA